MAIVSYRFRSLNLLTVVSRRRIRKRCRVAITGAYTFVELPFSVGTIHNQHEHSTAGTAGTVPPQRLSDPAKTVRRLAGPTWKESVSGHGGNLERPAPKSQVGRMRKHLFP